MKEVRNWIWFGMIVRGYKRLVMGLEGGEELINDGFFRLGWGGCILF